MIMVRLLSTRAFMVGFGTTKLTRVWEPALLWNQLRSNFDFFRFSSHLEAFETGRKMSVIGIFRQLSLGTIIPPWSDAPKQSLYCDRSKGLGRCVSAVPMPTGFQ